MMKDLAKAFIIMTLVFEVMTIAGLTAFYHVFGIICIVVVIATILFHIFKNMGSIGDGSGEIIPEGA
ncbi:MAG: hypothetical protein K6E91_06785 [Butyrivibrio sp.]|nr:hypothetical protein [Butyrivibrio sp.]